MIVHTLSLSGTEALNDLIQQIKADLLNTVNVHLFDMVYDTSIADRNIQNAATLNYFAGQTGVLYAIWELLPEEGTLLRYIGHVNGSYARTRMRNHFIRKNPRTGSQLANVNDALRLGSNVGVSFVAIDPPALRLYVEDLLIKSEQPLWNIKGKLRRLNYSSSTSSGKSRYSR